MLDAVPVGAEFLVNSHTAGNQDHPTIAADAAGNVVVAWTSDGQDGDGRGVYAQRYDPAGVPQGEEFRVNTYTTGDQHLPKVAMDGDGDLVIAWISRPLSGQVGQDGSGSGVYAQRYNSAGIPLGDEFRANTYTTGNQGGASSIEPPAVAMDDDGNFVAAWQSYDQASAWDVFAQRYDAAGVPQRGEFQVNTYTTARQWRPAAATDADGDVVIAWESEQGSPGASIITAQRYSASGVAQGAEFRVNTLSTEPNGRAAVAMDPDGNFVVAWTRGVFPSWDVYARRFDAGGVAMGDEFLVNTYTPIDQGNPSVAMNAEGKFVIAWQGRTLTSPKTASPTTVYGQFYNADGIQQGGEFRASTFTSGSQNIAKGAMDDVGNFLIAFRHTPPGGDNDIFARRFTLSPAVAASDFVFATAPHELRFTFNHDASPTLGTEDLIVQNLTTGQTIPSSAFSLSYDTSSNTATFTYTGTTGGITGMLPDGQYRATILAAGTALETDYSTEFLFMQGDANNDGRVNLADFNVLASNFGQSPRDFTQGDFNYDSQVNLADFNILAGRFGVALAPSTSTLSTFGFGRHLGAEEEAEPDLLA